MRVLVADDQEIVREVIGHVLSEAGHEVVATAADGREAFVRTRELHPDVVILDLGMPLLDGITTLRLLRDADPSVRIVVHTAYDDEALTVELYAAGSAAVVVKSTDTEPLLRALDGLPVG
jgi:two-component system chemotaxis response regulator CheY